MIRINTEAFFYFYKVFSERRNERNPVYTAVLAIAFINIFNVLSIICIADFFLNLKILSNVSGIYLPFYAVLYLLVYVLLFFGANRYKSILEAFKNISEHEHKRLRNRVWMFISISIIIFILTMYLTTPKI